MNFRGRDIISIKDFEKKEINYILNYAKKMIPYAKGEGNTDILKGKILFVLQNYLSEDGQTISVIV